MRPRLDEEDELAALSRLQITGGVLARGAT
jgi:hypothetical protein